jgi:predicted HTH domain antitoxin
MKVTIDLPDSLLKELTFGFTDLEKEIKFLLAVKLVEMGRISTGRASEWIGIAKPIFLREMGRYGLSAFPLNERTLEQDILDARKSIC